MQSKMTPGPWHWQRLENHILIEGGIQRNWSIANVYGVFSESGIAEANAKAIAALPELIAALRLLLAIYSEDDTEATDQAKEALRRAGIE